MGRGVVTQLEVVAREWVTPHLVRLEFGGVDGASLASFPMNEFADAYVKLELPPRGVELGFPYDVEQIRETRPAHEWPVLRTYTIRWFDAARDRLAMDFVVHGDDGVAGPWARDVEPYGPGAKVQVRGPGGAYSPDLEADHHLLVGDASALPAIAAAVERLPLGASADVVIGVENSGDEIALPSEADVSLRWIHAACNDTDPGEAIVAATTALELPDGDVHAFVHGEAGWVKALRSHLRFERQIPRERLSISGYWRLGANDEQWREGKRAWNEAVEAEEQARAS
ncbi:siderophore-interacting protein [Litorihabitans aurantiacus]|uniref:Siderophore-interacting protein n=1 Tax=Litorihabitans aurantiacus TaxID=1930061 RepID=A0AA37XDM8_9MICO|nr:siderophore-interacting protein [Litorihabitans aurantiacus]GMA30182.1 siderophore-interacting protein [Litorihabitans aurantiacus]